METLWSSFTIRKDLGWSTPRRVHTKILNLLLKSKDKFFNVFKLWLPRVKKTSGENLGYLQTDSEGEFISIALKDFYKEKSITIG